MFWQSDCFSVNLIAVYKQMSDWFPSERTKLEDFPSMKLFYLFKDILNSFQIHDPCWKIPLPYLRLRVLRFSNDSSFTRTVQIWTEVWSRDGAHERNIFNLPRCRISFRFLFQVVNWIPKDAESILNSEITPKFQTFPDKNYRKYIKGYQENLLSRKPNTEKYRTVMNQRLGAFKIPKIDR